MFSSIVDLFRRVPITALVLFYGFIPTIFLSLTVIFIMLHVGAICPTTTLDLLFDNNESNYYQITFQFIDAGQEFIGYFIDIMFNLIKATFDALLGDENFLDSFTSNGGQCPDVEFPIQPLEEIENLKDNLNND